MLDERFDSKTFFGTFLLADYESSVIYASKWSNESGGWPYQIVLKISNDAEINNTSNSVVVEVDIYKLYFKIVSLFPSDDKYRKESMTLYKYTLSPGNSMLLTIPPGKYIAWDDTSPEFWERLEFKERMITIKIKVTCQGNAASGNYVIHFIDL